MNTEKDLIFYKSITNRRSEQAYCVYNALLKHFKFERVECIETGASQDINDGCFGIYLAKISESSGGIFNSVDISNDIVDKSKKIYNEYLPNFNISHNIKDSIIYLKEYNGSPNLVHLDSLDLDITNPIPSMLHTWLEFIAIKDKMPSGSIILVDDNFMKGTWVNWNYITNGKYTGDYIKVDINYDIIGKGSLIYHWCKNYDTDWELIGDHYIAGSNIKLIIKKK